jgi:hypothetical protein
MYHPQTPIDVQRDDAARRAKFAGRRGGAPKLPSVDRVAVRRTRPKRGRR